MKVFARDVQPGQMVEIDDQLFEIGDVAIDDTFAYLYAEDGNELELELEASVWVVWVAIA